MRLSTSELLRRPVFGEANMADVARQPVSGRNYFGTLSNPFASDPVKRPCEPFRYRQPRKWKIQMSIRKTLSAAVLGTIVAMSAAAANANTFSPHMCDGAVSMRACGSHMAYLETLARARHGDASR